MWYPPKEHVQMHVQQWNSFDPQMCLYVINGTLSAAIFLSSSCVSVLVTAFTKIKPN